ncbi:Piwi-domain-containing protein [Armillaria gallica]|uniref:Piwi-domain-containing protein n=1 Tax=Armillaria gallica TaxID=47427 RepID=A0A2H3D3T3_ARMGA|nr:Piwi-domain-containing protein [Armillaria gallica]
MPPKSSQVPARSSGPAIRGLRGGARVRAPQTRLPVGPAPSGNDHITTIGVKRTAFGAAVISSDKTVVLPARFNMELFKHFQTDVAPEVFTHRAVYDGRKIAFTVKKLPVNEKGSVEFKVPYGVRPAGPDAGAPRIFKIKLTEAAVVNPEVLKRLIAGNHSQENSVLTAITALNVVVRMEPSLNHPFNIRSFFTNSETANVGLGVELWRGYFQSVRPTIGSMFINIDISTGPDLKAGDIRKLARQISGVRVTVKLPGRPDVERVMKKLSLEGARAIRFTSPKNGPTNVVDHILRMYNVRLQNPDWICAEVGNGAFIPIELCHIRPGQIMRKEISGDVIEKVRGFSSMKPGDRLQSIKQGLNVLAYGQSDYVRHFGMTVTSTEPLQVDARVLAPPVLAYGGKSRQKTITPNNGTWNMIDKLFYESKAILKWSLIIFEQKMRFNEAQCLQTTKAFIDACRKLGTYNIFFENLLSHFHCTIGMQINDKPRTTWFNSQGAIEDALVDAARDKPTLIVVILPMNANHVYNTTKHLGDCVAGIPTQCMLAGKCYSAKPQYFANVCLKLNVKLGGINVIPSPESVPALTDVRHPTMIIGADVMHPPSGANDRPSFTAVGNRLGSVDSHTAKYYASTPETSSWLYLELIQDYCDYHKHIERKAQVKPERIIVYRDGVSEGQFKEVLDTAACQALAVDAKITFVIVGKRHHLRFFPMESGPADRSENCLAGTVVDRGVGHPTEFDFYLQSHGGLLGTSRPTHYSVSPNCFFCPDDLQSLTKALCYVYARSTRAVSIPAPVHYADAVCSRANNHFSSDSHLGTEEDWSASSDAGSGTPVEILEKYRKFFKPVHGEQRKRMYFQVGVFVDLLICTILMSS